jgi:hypothetical protein
MSGGCEWRGRLVIGGEKVPERVKVQLSLALTDAGG